MGLVHEVCEPEQVLPRALEYARNLAATVAPSSLAETKRQLYTDLHRDAASAVADSEGLLNRMTREPDYREGVRAWLEKRPPQWPPR